MENSIEINPTDKTQEICLLLQKLNCKYEIHSSNTDEEYNYLEENDICIKVQNPNCEYPIYIDLEYKGKFSLSYYKWHCHYFGEDWDYDRLCEDLIDILSNNKCVIIINSNKRWLCSELSEMKIDKRYDYNNDIKKLPKEFQKEIEILGGKVELFYWNIKDNIVVKI